MRDFSSRFKDKSSVGGKGPSSGVTDFLDEAEVEKAKSDGRFIRMPAHMFYPDPNQPRKTFTSDALAELRASIESNGQLQPILVEPADAQGHYRIIAGERRWRAISESNILDVDAVIKSVRDDDELSPSLRRLVMQLSENKDRENMLAVEESAAVSEFYNLCVKEGKDRDFVCKWLQISNGQLTKHLCLASAPSLVAGLSLHGETQDIEVLYNLSKLSEDHPEKVSGFVEKWRSGSLDGNLRKEVKNLVADVREESDSGRGVREKKAQREKRNARDGGGSKGLSNFNAADADLKLEGANFKLCLTTDDGKSVEIGLDANIVIKLKKQIASNWS